MKLKVKDVKSGGYATKVISENGDIVKLRPFIYLKSGDELEFLPSIEAYTEVNRIFRDKGDGEIKKFKVCPPYRVTEVLFLGSHKFEIIFRERVSLKDWTQVRQLERFHYRGKGLNKLVGRRTVLLAELKDCGIVGFGVLSSTVAAIKPRFELLKTNFSHQMKSKLINRIARIPRVVIHPEFRGMNLGVLMARHLVRYAKSNWDINNYTPIMVEVVAAMIEYHQFFEKAGFIRIGYTEGYKNGVIPGYGNGGFAFRANYKSYDFMENQKPKPYLVFPIDGSLRQRIKKSFGSINRVITSKSPKLRKPITFDRVSVRYNVRIHSTERTKKIKEVFGIDVENAFSTVIRNFSLVIEPGDVVLLAGASGSGKSTIIRLLTSRFSSFKKRAEIAGKVTNNNPKDVAILSTNMKDFRPLIELLHKNGDIKEAIEILNSVGLSEAHLYLKQPDQISDGQLYRFAVARLCDSQKPIWIADEFVSTLNPEMAGIVAKGLRKVAHRYGATLILAAPHIRHFIDLLLPNKLIKLRWGTEATVYSVKVEQASHNMRTLSLSIVNNGSLSLTNVKIGAITMNGSFKTYQEHRSIEPRNSINTTLDLGRRDYYALAITTAEGVGEMLYWR